MRSTAIHDAPALSYEATGFGRAAKLTHVFGLALYVALAIVFLWFGAMKFTDYEAGGIAGLS